MLVVKEQLSVESVENADLRFSGRILEVSGSHFQLISPSFSVEPSKSLHLFVKALSFSECFVVFNTYRSPYLYGHYLN